MKRRSLCWCLFVVCSVGPVLAGGGVAELELDRSSMLAFIDAALPAPETIDAAGLGRLTLEVRPPERLQFREGGIEVEFPIRLLELGWGSTLYARYVPRIGRARGIVRLEPESARLGVPLPFRFDIAAWLPPIELPRRFDWPVRLEHSELQVVGFLQGLRVEEDRVVVELALQTRKASPTRLLKPSAPARSTAN